MICPNCGDNIEGEAGFCPTCGAKIEAAAETITEAMNAPVGNEAPKKSKKKLIIAVVAVVAVISIIVALVMPYILKNKYDGKYYFAYCYETDEDPDGFKLVGKIDRNRYLEIKGDKATLYDGKVKTEYTDIKFEGDKVTGKYTTVYGETRDIDWTYYPNKKVIFIETMDAAFKK